MHIHILGICGTFMGGLARLALDSGIKVTGTDANAYPPMSTQLESLGIEITKCYETCFDNQDPDLVVIGNTLSRANPAIEYVLDNDVPYMSGPAWIGTPQSSSAGCPVRSAVGSRAPPIPSCANGHPRTFRAIAGWLRGFRR